jgi:hypothetical protein
MQKYGQFNTEAPNGSHWAHNTDQMKGLAEALFSWSFLFFFPRLLSLNVAEDLPPGLAKEAKDKPSSQDEVAWERVR